MKYLFAPLLALLLIGCNSSKQLTKSVAVEDSAVEKGIDTSLSLSTSKTAKEDYERFTSMLYDLKETVDQNGKPIVQPVIREIQIREKGNKQITEATKTEKKGVDTTQTQLKAVDAHLAKQSQTQVFPGWLHFALVGLSLVLVCLFGFIIYLHKRQSKKLV